MATTSPQEYNSARQVAEDTLQSFNLKIVDNLDRYVLLIIGIDNDHFLSENLPCVISEHYIKRFNDIESSLAFIHSLHDTNIFVIISAILGKEHADKFSNERQIVGIYVYCMDEDKHRMWAEAIKKIRCTVSDATKLLTQLHHDIKEVSTRWPFDTKSFQKATTSISQWYHLFLLVICYQPKSIEGSYKEMFKECRTYYQTNPGMLKKIDRFQQTYKPDNAIYEYTRDSFLYRIVNHALRTKNMEIIRKFSPYIRDLHTQIHHYHHTYYKSKQNYIRAVYRGQNLSVDELENLRSIFKSNNPVITLATFSSTSLDPDVALSFISHVDGLIPCLFEIIIPDNYNPNQEDMLKYEQAFANISSLSAISEEQEVLFSLITHFAIKHIGCLTTQSNRVWVPIVLELITKEEAGSIYSHFGIIKWVEDEMDPQIHTDVLDMLQVNAEDELKFKSTNWTNWWNNLKRNYGKGIGGQKLPLNLIFYDCFTDDNHWSRKAIELHKIKLRTVPAVQSNSSSFQYLFRDLKMWSNRPAIQIAIYEDYLKQFCDTDTKEIVQCLCSAGEAYGKIADKESALKCYEKALNMNVDDKYKMNNNIQQKIKVLQKPDKITRTEDNTKRTSVINDSNQEFLQMYEAQQGLWALYPIIHSEVVGKFPITECLKKIYSYIERREEWYDTADSRIILRLPYELTEDLSVNDYRNSFLPAVHAHITSRNSIKDAANNYALSLWRYEKYMDQWMLCKELERLLQPFQKKWQLIRCKILPRLQRLIKKLLVLISIVTIYICIEQGSYIINVNNMQPFDKENPITRHRICVNLQNSDLQAGLAVSEDESSVTNETADYTIPDRMRLVSPTFTDFIQSIT